MIVVIDNYDSFTYNIVQYLGELGAKLEIYRNDAIGVAAVAEKRPAGILLSPGPCTPNEAGICLELVHTLSGHIPILGVCLGHQTIGQAFGGTIIRAKRIMHGKTSAITHHDVGVFRNLPNPFDATRYHSLVIDPASTPRDLDVIATSLDDGEIMGVAHRTHPTQGVQFHPESILTLAGKQLLNNWLIDINEYWDSLKNQSAPGDP
ncbi:MAG: aminodeoxychorismate/anthranilate synthase component II [Myxococcales bacterium]|nr:aminodeoxychorismate/anthranilate synthase component II [Myxococcales bacterium]